MSDFQNFFTVVFSVKSDIRNKAHATFSTTSQGPNVSPHYIAKLKFNHFTITAAFAKLCRKVTVVLTFCISNLMG